MKACSIKHNCVQRRFIQIAYNARVFMDIMIHAFNYKFASRASIAEQ